MQCMRFCTNPSICPPCPLRLQSCRVSLRAALPPMNFVFVQTLTGASTLSHFCLFFHSSCSRCHQVDVDAQSGQISGETSAYANPLAFLDCPLLNVTLHSSQVASGSCVSPVGRDSSASPAPPSCIVDLIHDLMRYPVFTAAAAAAAAATAAAARFSAQISSQSSGSQRSAPSQQQLQQHGVFVSESTSAPSIRDSHASSAATTSSAPAAVAPVRSLQPKAAAAARKLQLLTKVCSHL